MKIRHGILYCILSLLLAGYIATGAVLSLRLAAEAELPATSPVLLVIEESRSTTKGFVTPSQVMELIKPEVAKAGNRVEQVDTRAIAMLLNDVDNIESAWCYRQADDRIMVHVIPMQPVARIVNGSESYYVNRAGKRLTASAAYRADVPIIQGGFGTAANIDDIMPVLDRMESDAQFAAMVTAIVIEDDGDLVAIPPVRGHVINLGDCGSLDNKIGRLETFYRRVMPVKGWDYYDTLSVKYRSQLVATRRHARRDDPLYIEDPEGDQADEPDLSTMTTTPGAASDGQVDEPAEAPAAAAPATTATQQPARPQLQPQPQRQPQHQPQPQRQPQHQAQPQSQPQPQPSTATAEPAEPEPQVLPGQFD